MSNDQAHLAPPQRPFAGEGGDSSGDNPQFSSHSRQSSATGTDSPPITPRSLSFQLGATGNHRTSTTGSPSPAHTPAASLFVPQNQYFEPHRRTNSGLSSLAEFPRNSSSLYDSRPTTAGDNSRPSSRAKRDTFASPRTRPLTMSSLVDPMATKIKRDMPKSTMLDKDVPIEKPWLQEKDPYNRIAYWLTYAVMLFGIVGGAARCYLGWTSVPLMKGNLCMVMDEDFSTSEGMFGENGKFFREVEMSGFGNGQFEMTTDTDDTAYVKDGKLYITPRLTSDLIGEEAVLDGHVYNITGCTFNMTRKNSYTSQEIPLLDPGLIGSDEHFDVEGYRKACSAVSNVTTGQVINPVRSARLSTRLGASIKFGRVEVRAKIPRGDWLWPAIWMLPVDNAYGGWPLSGEIDIMEARGNGPDTSSHGSNHVFGSLHWGPSPGLNRVWRTTGWWFLRRGSYDQDYHTYTLEWDEEFIRIYVDTRLHHMLEYKIKDSFWEAGHFPKIAEIGGETVMTSNIWANATKAAPFDQKFYLLLNVAVGGTNGWFSDAKTKPWMNQSPTAMLEFWREREKWYPTWGNEEQRSMIVDSVKMWEKC